MSVSNWISLASVLGVGGMLVWARHSARSLWQMARDWSGQPERRGPGGMVIEPARPALLERMAVLEKSVAEIRKEVHPNSGTSLRDVVDRLDERVDRLDARLGERDRPKVEAGGLGFQAEIA